MDTDNTVCYFTSNNPDNQQVFVKTDEFSFLELKLR